MSLRIRMVLLLLAVLVPAFAGFAWLTSRNMQHAEDALRVQVQSRAQAIRDSMELEIQRHETIIRLLVNSPQLQGWDVPGFCRLARSVSREESGPIVLARGGTLVMGTVREDCQPVATGLGRLPDPITSGRVHITDLYHRSFGDRMMALYQTFVRDGHIYQLSIGIRPEALQEQLERNAFDQGWNAAVMNSVGRVIARVPEPEAWIGRQGSEFAADPSAAAEFWRNGVGPTEGWRQGRAADGTLMNVVFSRSSRYGLTVFIGYPQSAAAAAAHTTVIEESLITAGLMLLGLLLAAWVTGQIADPVQSLRRAAEDLKADRPVTLARYGVPEFDGVAESMEEASLTIRSHSDELQRRVDEAVNKANDSSAKLMQAQKLEVIGRLSGGIAHDFNNLLQTLSTCLTLLEQMVIEPKSTPLVEAGLRAVDRASRLVQQLLALGRNVPIDRQPVDLRTQLLGMEVLLSRTLVGNVRLHVDLAPGLWRVLTDPVQLEVALLNLVFNARDALPNGGQISLSATNQLREGREGVLLSVTDLGEGIAPALLTRIFEPFVTTKPVGRGTGLGLSQVRDFALASEGGVEVESVQGVGTTFKLWLPRAMGESVERLPVPDAVASRDGRVLLVEDDPLIAEVVASALQDTGFRVQRCISADDALRYVRAGGHLDVVFSDVLTGGDLNGLQLVEVLRKEFPALPVVLTTGYVESLRVPPHCVVLAKPYSMQKLFESLDTAIRSHSATDSPVQSPGV